MVSECNSFVNVVHVDRKRTRTNINIYRVDINDCREQSITTKQTYHSFHSRTPWLYCCYHYYFDSVVVYISFSLSLVMQNGICPVL